MISAGCAPIPGFKLACGRTCDCDAEPRPSQEVLRPSSTMFVSFVTLHAAKSLGFSLSAGR